MKLILRLSPALCLAILGAATPVACRKSGNAKEVASAGQDTTLMQDLAEANRNTSTTVAVDNTLNTAGTGGAAVPAPGKAQSPPPASEFVPRPAPRGSGVSRPRPRLKVPTKAADAPAPTTVPLDRSPASGAQISSGDPCDSATPVDQRLCLDRTIGASDADLNRTYQELLSQARKSGGAELEDKFQRSQRDWINQRDTDCTTQTPSENGKLWAKARAHCLADYSSKRTAELQRNLNNLRGQ